MGNYRFDINSTLLVMFWGKKVGKIGKMLEKSEKGKKSGGGIRVKLISSNITAAGAVDREFV